jgi:3-hydroxybutyryl-CoA dehydrogenase
VPALKVVVIGPGLMGRGIASLFAQSGARVGIVGTTRARAQDSLRAWASGSSAVEAVEIDSSFVAEADLVVESVREDLKDKRDVLAVADSVNRDGLLVTNTSSLDLEALSEVVTRPQRFAGMHFLNPPTETWVVEIARCQKTGQAALDALCELSERLGKVPLVLHKPIPGYIWNRLQFALLRECLHLLKEGVCDVETIDAAVSDGLAPRWLGVGPLGTVDLGGTTVFSQIAQELFPVLGCDPALVSSFPQDGGHGFYGWSQDERDRRQRLRADALRLARNLRSQSGLVAGGSG